jgi:hypothetical protein
MTCPRSGPSRCAAEAAALVGAAGWRGDGTLEPRGDPSVRIGLGAPDDAAVSPPQGKAVQTVDFFGHTTTHASSAALPPIMRRATSTRYASFDRIGDRNRPHGPEDKVEEELHQMLRRPRCAGGGAAPSKDGSGEGAGAALAHHQRRAVDPSRVA